MPFRKLVLVLMTFAIWLFAQASPAQSPLPDLRVEATDGGSVLHVANRHAQPLTAFLIELVGYPGSSFSLWHDDTEEGIAAGTTRAFPITNMTVGAVPEYVKMQAAIYADGSTAGTAQKATQLVERRLFSLGVMRELVQKLEAASAANTPKEALAASLSQWSEGLPQPTRSNRNSQEAINNTAARGILAAAVARLAHGSVDDVLEELRGRERALRESKPAR
ncbi:MAG: hypothetical protein KIT83_17165 [Bryobacterales bacterium]|nr:hypothetical protein [Bryobacterales bacterium]